MRQCPKTSKLLGDGVFDEEKYLVIGIMRWRGTARTLSVSLVLAMLLNLGGIAPSWAAPKTATKPTATKLAGKVSETSPPDMIQQLSPLLDKYQPQVSIASPRQNEVLQDNTVSVKFNVKDLPLYKDEKLGLGSHLHVFLDDQPYQAVYDVSQPVVFKDLAAGTHTIRAFAGRPWHESFKNDGAYAQTTFHVFTKTPNNNPDPKLSLLTYSRPQATYGAESILLDFYLTNAPLHIVAQEDDKDDIPDWRVKVTVNGDSFTLDRWQSIYLKGFKPGKNWVQLEYVDEKGNPVENVYNNTARVFNYEPNGQDSLSKLVRGEIPFDQAVMIVDRDYKPVVETPKPEVAPVAPPVVEQKPTEGIEETPKPIKEAPKPAEAPKPIGGFFNRFKRSEPKPIVTPTPELTPEPEKAIAPPATIEPPEPVTIEPSKPETPEAPAEKPKGGFFDRFKRPTVAPVPAPIPDEIPVIEEPTPIEQSQPEVKNEPETIEIQPAPEVKEAPKANFFDRFRHPNAAPVPTPIPDESTAIEEPTSIEQSQPEVKDEPETIEVQPAPEVKEAPKANFFDRFKRPESKPSIVLPSPTSIPEDLTTPQIEAPEPVEIKPAEPEAKPEPQPNLIENLRPATPNPVETSIQQEKPPAVEELAPEVAPASFKPQTELERRLGMPLEPRLSEPVRSSQDNAE